MKTFKNLSWMAGALLIASAANAQLGRGGPEWTTGNADVQRDSWIKTDSYINLESMSKPGFAYLWKTKLSAKPTAKLSQAIMLQTFIGYRGFKQLTFIADGSNTIYSLDFDLGRAYWDKHFDVAAGTLACSAASVSTPGRNSPLVPPAPGRGLGGAVRPRYHSTNGVPGEGAPADAAGPGFAAPAAPAATASAATAAPQRPATPPAAAAGTPFGKQLPIYFVTSDGVLHALGQASGKETEKPTQFLPAGSSASDVALVDGFIYAASLPGCAGANQVFAMDAESKAVTNWKADGAILGAPAFSSTGNLYVTSGKSLVMLQAKTLAAKTLASTPAEFVSVPVLMKLKDQEIVAAGTADGEIVLVDAASGEMLGSAAVSGKATSLSSFEDAGGSRWILAVDGKAAKSSVQALKLTVAGGKATLAEAWKSPEMDGATAPAIINGVVFALSKGTAGSPAVLYALDATSGKKLWDSGKSVTSHVTTGGLSASNGQIYFATADNTLYAFGFPADRQW